MSNTNRLEGILNIISYLITHHRPYFFTIYDVVNVEYVKRDDNVRFDCASAQIELNKQWKIIPSLGNIDKR